MAIMALHSSATGLRALSTQLDVIANNLANANNNGFKSSRVNFEDLFYQNFQQPGVQTNGSSDTRPVGLMVGLGTRVSSTQTDFSQGSAVETKGPLDLFIQGDGFFQVKVLQGQGDGFAYTRTGSFAQDKDGNLVLLLGDGYKLDPAVTIDKNATKVDVSQDGRIFFTIPGQSSPVAGPQLQLARFSNPAGLLQIGSNLFQKTDASGEPKLANPGSEGAGILRQGFLEASNVDPVKELVDLIKTQRTFELNSQSIQASDQMLQQISNLRR